MSSSLITLLKLQTLKLSSFVSRWLKRRLKGSDLCAAAALIESDDKQHQTFCVCGCVSMEINGQRLIPWRLKTFEQLTHRKFIATSSTQPDSGLWRFCLSVFVFLESPGVSFHPLTPSHHVLLVFCLWLSDLSGQPWSRSLWSSFP